MSSLIAELWRGNLDPSCYFGRNNSEIKKLENLMERNYVALEQKLNSEEKEILVKYSENVIDYIIVTSEQAFCDGFSIGMKIIAEALTGIDE